MVVAGGAWVAFWRAFGVFGLLSIGARDVGKSVAYAAVSIGSFALSFWLWCLA